ncbi:MAG: hypothetical protein ACLP01_32330 [Solirubrobacteraceae bacterium]
MGLLKHRTEVAGIRDLEDGNVVDQVLLVRDIQRRQTRAGADYMRLSLADRTGVVTGFVWDEVEHACATARIGDPVRVIGTFSRHPTYGPQVTVDALGIPPEVDWEQLLAGPAATAGELERQVSELLASLRDRHLGILMETSLTSHRIWRSRCSTSSFPTTAASNTAARSYQ